MTEKAEIFKQIMDNYKSGKYGDESLHLSEIMEISGYPDLLEQMTEQELRYLRDNKYIPDILFSFALKAKNKK